MTHAEWQVWIANEWGKSVETARAQKEWVGLTDEEAMQIWDGVIKYALGEVRVKDFARAIEAKLRSKNDQA
jgi:hypothetical protein